MTQNPDKGSAEVQNVVDLKRESVEILHKKAVQRFNSLTYAIIGEISAMLRKAKLMPIPELQAHNPTFDKVVEQLRLYRSLSGTVADLLGIDEQKELSMLDEYIELADDLAQAIIADSFDALCGAIAALDEKPYI
ncbi:hypothetical protein MXF13_09150 [Leclercia adecarboxylata]|uniref:hypothetical protein n=1 Tax=Leclercia adecarboxylata TaxID=83655 RepID=UPI002DB7F78C|nr:hypothetical protein [Leclercia adecarboxylata]MEB5750043.1 hypothetical protein [Leclercia adecarboxylata]